MESFNDHLILWQPFFSAVAGVSATLAGLLFVSLSINREKVAAQENRILLRLAQRSFGDLLFALFIALMFLVPNHVPYCLGIPLLIVAAVRCWGLVHTIRRQAQDPAANPGGLATWREHAFAILSCLGLLVAGVEVCQGVVLATFLLVPVIAMLLYNAGMNAWLLLVVEKQTDEKSP